MFAPPLYIPSIAPWENPVKPFAAKEKNEPYNQSFVIRRSEFLIARLTVEEKKPYAFRHVAHPLD